MEIRPKKSTGNYISNGPQYVLDVRARSHNIHSKGLMCIPSHAGDGAGAGPLQGRGAVAL